jgi:O-methyltransferase
MIAAKESMLIGIGETNSLPPNSGMSIKRRIADFLIKTCSLRRLRNGRLQSVVRNVLDEIDLQHLRDSNPCPSAESREQMYRVMHESYIGNDAIDYLEFGVFQGASMAHWVDLNRRGDSRFFGFDSFEGLPENWRPGQSIGHFDVAGAIPSIDDPRIHFVKGWFQDTLPAFARGFSRKNRLVLHIDADLYSSSMLALMYFGPFMSKGTLLIFDEFYDREHEFKAFVDWRRVYKRDFRVVAQMDNYGKVCIELL